MRGDHCRLSPDTPPHSTWQHRHACTQPLTHVRAHTGTAHGGLGSVVCEEAPRSRPMTVSEARAPVSSALVVQRLGTHPPLPTRGRVSSQQKPPHPRERDPSPRDLRWPSPKAPRWDDLSGGVRGNLRHGPPPAVCTDTRGGGGAGQPSPQLPRGAGLLWGPAVPRGAPRQTGPVPPALRQELEPSCTWRSGGKADVEASAAHQQAPLFVPWTRRHGRSVLAEYTGNSTFRCIGVFRNMFNVMVLGNLEI